MKQNEATIFIFIASIIIGVLISSNMNFSKFNNKVLLNPSDYQQAYNYNMKLNKDIRNLKEEYSEYNKKLKKYKDNSYNKHKLQIEMEDEVSNNEMILGNKDVEGEGIEITLEDASLDKQSQIVSPNDYWNLIIHDKDITLAINDLRFAGAEAISVNGQRIIGNSSVLCWGVFTEINGVKIPAPFNIKAIGDKEKLYSYIEGYESYISILKLRGINVNISKKDKIKILGNDKKLDYNYMKETKIYNKK
ncbi:hypothetical protein CLOHAE12215_02422 [Clostridium haemolyticum]|uniref:DUF881 domain-containing protein n=1 Tax=Clostridium haemolyticum TaxID=84025 RepID=UPI0009C9AB05|nr:DUF881 domain-containing protein [Clostridium haemolyticum]OOB75371.1 division initiation protein [Clostridium haemolyticum]CAG7840998.1 hypothetical protein CLOHAE12215_02422 [Clostridium haemolyticum]